MVNTIRADAEDLSIQNIVENQLLSKGKQTYKLRRTQSGRISSLEPDADCEESVTIMEHYRLVRIKVKPQLYFGKPAIVLLLKDVSKKTAARLQERFLQEKQEAARQAENFTSTVSHEMRTPLGNILFFLKLVLNFLGSLPLSLDFAIEVSAHKKYLNLSIQQVLLMQSFVDDLLDMKQLKSGVFRLVQTVFDPNETFQLVCDIFRPQTQAKGVALNWQIVSNLFEP